MKSRVTAVTRPVVAGLRRHGRLVATGMLGLAAAAAALLRRPRREEVSFPDPEPLVAETTASVYNAAKGSVIGAVRQADAPDQALVGEAVRSAVIEAAGAGADVLAATIGAVEGATESAHLLGTDRRHVAEVAASAAVAAAALQGLTAADRVRNTLRPYLDR